MLAAEVDHRGLEAQRGGECLDLALVLQDRLADRGGGPAHHVVGGLDQPALVALRHQLREQAAARERDVVGLKTHNKHVRYALAPSPTPAPAAPAMHWNYKLCWDAVCVLA